MLSQTPYVPQISAALVALVVLVLGVVLRGEIARAVRYVVSIYTRAGAGATLSPAERSFLKLSKSIAYTIAGVVVVNLHTITSALSAGALPNVGTLASQITIALLSSVALAWDKYKTAQGDSPLASAGAAALNDVAAHVADAKSPLITDADLAALKAAVVHDLSSASSTLTSSPDAIAKAVANDAATTLTGVADALDQSTSSSTAEPSVAPVVAAAQ